MKPVVRLLSKLGLLSSFLVLPVGPTFAQQDITKPLVEKLTARIAKLESACASDIKKYCKTVTPGEGRMIYCMQAHEDKISPQCDYELGEVASSVQASLDGLKDGIIACKAEITGVCGKTVPGQGRMAACLSANKSTASKDCVDAISKIEAMAAQ
jgi:cysteine rich repeat protein